jgi:hypothetical protein
MAPTSSGPASSRNASTRSSRLTAALALALSASLALTPAATSWAAPAGTPGAIAVEVLSFSSNDAVDEAGALTDAFKHALVAAPGVSDHGKSHALEAVALTAGCDDPMAAACGPKLAAEIKHDKFIYGTVKKTPPNKITATLTFYNAGQVKTVAKTYDAGPVAKDGASPELKKIATDALFALMGGAPKGKVDITVSGPAANENGELFENGQSLGALTAGKGSVELPSGSHTLELRVKGFSSTTGVVEVTPSGATLTLAPVRMVAPTPIDWQLYGGIAAVGVGVVFLGLGVSKSLDVKNAQDNATFTSYRQRWPSSEGDTCARAKEGKESPTGVADTKLAADVSKICDDASSAQTSQFVFYGLGTVLAIGGVVLIATDKGAAKDGKPGTDKTALRLDLRPVVTPQGSSLSLVGQF